MSTKILLVDDDVQLTHTIASFLTEADYTPLEAYTAEDGLLIARTQTPQLALLDVMVPTMGGLGLCRKIREFSDIPILFLTAMGQVDQVVQGLESGADDYIVKPFKAPELLARIKAHLRRANPLPAQPLLQFGQGQLTIDLASHIVTVSGQVVDLTKREFELLATLARNPGRVITINELIRLAWGVDHYTTDSIKPYIHYLRKKLETDPTAPKWIHTVRGVGYRFTEHS